MRSGFLEEGEGAVWKEEAPWVSPFSEWNRDFRCSERSGWIGLSLNSFLKMHEIDIPGEL